MSTGVIKSLGGAARVHQWAVAVFALVHAGLIAAWWWPAIYAESELAIPGDMWLLFTWTWALWPIYSIARRRTAPVPWIALAIGGALIAPALPMIVVFSAWAIAGAAA
jgi:hypothetical protein